MIGLRVKSSPDWKKYDKATLGVSLFSPNFEEDVLRTICAWINENYDEVLVDLTDSNNRHTFVSEGGMNPPDAYKTSIIAGDRWLNMAGPILSALTIPHHTIRWDRWRNDERFESYRSNFETAFTSNPVFRRAVLNDIEGYCLRRHGTSLQDTPKSIVEGCKNYILEEITCHSMMYEDRPAAIIYPGKSLECYEVLRNGLVSDAPAGVQNSYHVRLVLHGMSPKAAPKPPKLQAV